MTTTTLPIEDTQKAGCLPRTCSAEFTLDCIKATLASYNPELATLEELAQCWIRCSRAVLNYYKPVRDCASEMTAHIVAMEDADKAMEPIIQDRIRELEDALNEIYHQTSTTERQSEIIESALRLKPNESR